MAYRKAQMDILRIDIERALNEIISQEEGMRFQGLAVVLGKKRWPELIARQRKKDFGLDAYAPASLTPERIGKGLAASITPTLAKISSDASTAKKIFSDLKTLLFVTPAKVGNADRKQWEETIWNNYGLQLHIIEREEIITQMLLPENAPLCASFLHIHIDIEPQIAELIDRIRRATNAVIQSWGRRINELHLIDLTAERLDSNGSESIEILSLNQIDQALLQSRRILLEGPAGQGKTTTLIQLAQRERIASIPFIVELPAWISSRRGILEYIAGIPAFQAEGITSANLARVQTTNTYLFLLNGWNEITESNSAQANNALRELEQDFPGAGIIVATRTHHLTPPLPGALRLRLLRLRRTQRSAYLMARLGAKGTELRTLIETNTSLDELTRTPFILSEVASLFAAGVEIPSTKIGIIDEVLRLQEQRDEHRNALQSTPIFGLQKNYLKALATEMTRRGSVALHEAESRMIVASVARELVDQGQIEAVGAPAVLATLSAHHIIERLDYPQTAFRFGHQQLQEYYATLDIHLQLLDLCDEDQGATDRFTSEYVNNPAWTEPLRMIAETFAELTGDNETDKRNTRAGTKLLEMALTVDIVFAGELAQFCGEAVWNKVCAIAGKHFRSIYASHHDSYQQYALAAMLATGMNDFSDIIVPLLSGQDQQTRLRTYRLWPNIRTSSLGANWREQVREWDTEARANFVSELLHHRADGEIATFAAEDNDVEVKKAAVYNLMWNGSEEALIQILESMDAQTFDEVTRNNIDQMPAELLPKIIASMRKFIVNSANHTTRLHTTSALIKLGETDLDDIIKDVLVALPNNDIRNAPPQYIQSALEHLRKVDSEWVNEWIANHIGEGHLHEYDRWLGSVDSNQTTY